MIKILATVLFAVLFALPSFADTDRDCQVVFEAINPTEAQATDDFINLTDGTIGTSHAVEDEMRLPVGAKVWGLSVLTNAAPGGTDTWDISVVDDASATIVTCEILGTATSCEDKTHVAAVAKGSTLTVLVDSGNGTGDPDATGEMLVSFCLDY